ncbi:hypothetical protein LLEC1_07634 [Akanthomyces lecanii]|uniref:Protein YTP1-like C-terminal domain-containing protein n=1 Tax=Cordyceps confragosa TaxID=2714763 RepID=A0A179IIL3_CORDF|nr:hypothetical protein LLEC1_07634 [Akanthomyces lecanii]
MPSRLISILTTRTIRLAGSLAGSWLYILWLKLAGRLTDTWDSKNSRAGYRILHQFPPRHDSTPSARDSYYCQESRAFSNSDQVTVSQSSSNRSSSVSTICANNGGSFGSKHSKEHSEDNNDDELRTLPLSSPTPVTKNTRILSHSIWQYVEMGYKLADRVILPFGFIPLTTGIVTFARSFEGHAIFEGLAHWIKGGVFFWLGLFNFGRWSGSFAELGWAWMQDLEHMAIAVLFIRGGLCFMLIQSTHIRDLLNTTTTVVPVHSYSNEERERLEAPETYEFSLNPIPALVILLLGIMMSCSQHRATMTASMSHKQWGTLLLWASVARGLSYVLP